jgi:hypothetical protein
VFPNVTDIPFEPTSQNVQLGIPGRVPGITQNLGAEPARIELQCDLNVETDTYAWKRTGDVDYGDVFLDILHNQSVTAPWQWLVWGNKQCKVTLDDVLFSPRDNTVRVMGHEYSDSNKANEYYYQRWSLDT